MAHRSRWSLARGGSWASGLADRFSTAAKATVNASAVAEGDHPTRRPELAQLAAPSTS